MEQEEDENQGIGFSIVTSNFRCTERVLEPPRCPLGFRLRPKRLRRKCGALTDKKIKKREMFVKLDCCSEFLTNLTPDLY